MTLNNTKYRNPGAPFMQRYAVLCITPHGIRSKKVMKTGAAVCDKKIVK